LLAVCFNTALSFPVGNGPTAEAVGDFDGDGTLDVAVANQGDNTVSILENAGGGHFLVARTFAAGIGPVGVAVGDFNGDFKLDLAVVDHGDTSGNGAGVSILLGNGDGTFGAPTTFAAGSNPLAVATADLRKIGVDDLVVTNFGSSTASVLLGNGNGTFASPKPVNTGSGPDAVVLVDLNGDNKADMLVANSASQTVGVLLGNGDGSFQPAVNYAVAGNPSSLALGDFNGDGKTDVVTGNLGLGGVSVLLGNGNGTFQAALNSPAGGTPSAVAVGDFNGDGKQDVAVANSASGNVNVILGNGDGTFQAPVKYFGAANLVALVVADFHQSGRLDLAAVSDMSPGSLALLPATNAGTFTAPVVNDFGLNEASNTPVTYLLGHNPKSVTFGDFNGDGTLDLAVGDPRDNNVSIWLGNGDGTFKPAITFAAGTSPGAVKGRDNKGHIVDLNGDGKQDLVVTNLGGVNGTGSNLSVLFGNGNGTFQAPVTLQAGTQPSDVVVGDFNGDGNQDLAVTNLGDNTVSVLLGNGDGSFKPAVNYGVGPAPAALAIGDFRSDGKLDLAVTNVGTPSAGSNYLGSVSILLGNGDGTFQTALNYTAGVNPFSVVVGDFNGDGNGDVAVSNFSRGTVTVLLGNGDGTFGGPSSFQAGANPAALVTGDFNTDGNQDLAVADASNNTVNVLLGNGNGTFKAPANYFTGGNPVGLVIADFNGDGVLDFGVANVGQAVGTGLSRFVTALVGNGNGTFIAFAGVNDTRAVGFSVVADFNGDGVPDLATTTPWGLSVLLGNGNGTFQTPLNYAAGTSPGAVAAGDLNGDGRIDLVVANQIDGDVSVYLGYGNGTFNSPMNFSVGADPVAVAVVDLVGNHKLDIVTANRTSGTISVLMAIGNGLFQPAVNYSAGSTIDAMAVSDFNGDGKPDVAVANGGTGVKLGFVSILLGNGDGTFQSSINTMPLSAPVGLAVGDLNGDGKQDLAVANHGRGFSDSGNVSVLLSNGNGTFQVPTNLAAGPNPTSVVAADITGDGKLDLVVGDMGTGTDTSAALTVLAGNGDGTFQAGTTTAVNVPPVQVVVADFDGDGHLDVVDSQASRFITLLNLPPTIFATGAGTGGGPQVNVYESGGRMKFSFFAYDLSFLGGVRVAIGDVNGDGVPDIITAPGPGMAPLIRVFDGTNGGLMMEFMAFDPAFAGGAYVAAGEFDGDNKADIVVGADAGGGPAVEVFSGADGHNIGGFFAYDPSFSGGVRVAAADVNGDGHDDIITGAGPGGGPHVEVFDGTNFNNILQSFFAYDPNFNGGVFVAAGDVNHDGKADIITGAGAGGGPNVTIFSGADGSVLQSFFAYDPNFSGGVNVGVLGSCMGGVAAVLTGAGPGGGPQVEAFDPTSLAVVDSFFAFAPNFGGGVFVGGH
jgi:hypothetical protein